MSGKLCECCKINPATNSYDRKTKNGVLTEYYCLSCYRKVRADEKKKLEGLTKCPNCGCSVQEIRKTNLVGCEHCYKALSWAIQPIIQRMQGEKEHCDKRLLSPKERLQRRFHAVSVIKQNIIDKSVAEPYEEELERLQALLLEEDEKV